MFLLRRDPRSISRGQIRSKITVELIWRPSDLRVHHAERLRGYLNPFCSRPLLLHNLTTSSRTTDQPRWTTQQLVGRISTIRLQRLWVSLFSRNVPSSVHFDLRFDKRLLSAEEDSFPLKKTPFRWRIRLTSLDSLQTPVPVPLSPSVLTDQTIRTYKYHRLSVLVWRTIQAQATKVL